MVQERHPGVAEIIVGALEADSESPSIQAVLKCARILEGAGFERSLWAELAERRPLAPGGDEEDPCQPRVGWQKKAGTAIEQHHHDHVVWPRLREHQQAMLRSQRGPLALILPLSACSSSADFVSPFP